MYILDVKDKKIGYVLTGSFCTFSKTIPKMKELIDKGADIIPIITAIRWIQNLEKHKIL